MSRRRRDPVGQLECADEGIGSAAGNSHYGELPNSEMIGQCEHIVGPAENGAAGEIVGHTHPRAIHGDQPRTCIARDGIRELRLETGAGKSVEIEHRVSGGGTEFRVGQAPATAKRQSTISHWCCRG